MSFFLDLLSLGQDDRKELELEVVVVGSVVVVVAAVVIAGPKP